jgi:hypothetical protein
MYSQFVSFLDGTPEVVPSSFATLLILEFVGWKEGTAKSASGHRCVKGSRNAEYIHTSTPPLLLSKTCSTRLLSRASSRLVGIWFLARPLVLDATRVRKIWSSLPLIAARSCQTWPRVPTDILCRNFSYCSPEVFSPNG